MSKPNGIYGVPIGWRTTQQAAQLLGCTQLDLWRLREADILVLILVNGTHNKHGQVVSGEWIISDDDVAQLIKIDKREGKW